MSKKVSLKKLLSKKNWGAKTFLAYIWNRNDWTQGILIFYCRIHTPLNKEPLSLSHFQIFFNKMVRDLCIRGGLLKNRNFLKVIIESKLLNRIYKKRTKSKIWELYLWNWASYDHFHVYVLRNLSFAKFWNPKISLNFLVFPPNSCMRSWFLLVSKYGV